METKCVTESSLVPQLVPRPKDTSGQIELIQRAKAISKEERKKILVSFKETELHGYLKELFQRMEPNHTIEITHGVGELGKDLTIVKQDRLTTDIIGVVVKIGDIKGQTLGDVDDLVSAVKSTYTGKEERSIKAIESQIQQAFANPAELKSIFARLPITKALIILAGDLSGQARKRLEGELKGYIVEIRDIKWLVENFTEFYPQVFFEGRVVDFLQDRIQKLESKHLFAKRGVNLSEYFVEPMMNSVDTPLDIDPKQLIKSFDREKVPLAQLQEIIKRKKKVMIIGDPGSGKSGAMAKLTLDMLREAYSEVVKREGTTKRIMRLPLLVAAKDFQKCDSPKELCRKHGIPYELEGRAEIRVLIVDALDEIPAAQRTEMINKAETFVKELSSDLLITSRKIDAVKAPPSGFVEYELLPFQFSQAIQLFAKLTEDEKVLNALRDGLEKVKYQLPLVPLSLMLLLELVEENKEIPASVTELYDRFCDIALGRWDREKGIEVLFEYLIKRKFLSTLALKEFLSKQRLEISQNEFDDFYSDYASTYGWETGECHGFIQEIERTGILNIRDAISFRHRSFLDYFAASYIFDRRAEYHGLSDFLAEIYFNDLWGDTAFFYVGLMREIDEELLMKIIAFGENSIKNNIPKLLLGRLLQAGWYSTTSVKSFGIGKAVEFAPAVRENILDGAKKAKVNFPAIFGDVLVLGLSQLSFQSTFLAREMKAMIQELVKQPSSVQGLYKLLLLVWSCKAFLDHQELVDLTDKVLEVFPKVDIHEQARFSLILAIMSRDDKTTAKKVMKQAMRLMKKYPGVFRELLPERRKGFKPGIGH